VTVATATKTATTSPASPVAKKAASPSAAKPVLGRTQTLKGGSAMVLAGLASTANSRTKVSLAERCPDAFFHNLRNGIQV
jgi:hypothetical protein